MTKKRFDYNQYDDGFQSIYDRKNDEYLTDWDLSKIEELLNELHDENTHIKNTITEMYETERTEIGKSILRQLKEAIQ
jgi:hypothetical protein